MNVSGESRGPLPTEPYVVALYVTTTNVPRGSQRQRDRGKRKVSAVQTLHLLRHGPCEVCNPFTFLNLLDTRQSLQVSMLTQCGTSHDKPDPRRSQAYTAPVSWPLQESEDARQELCGFPEL